MRLDVASRRAKERERKLRREIERDDSRYEAPKYERSAGSLTDCKGECGKVVFPFRNDGYCSDCKPEL